MAKRPAVVRQHRHDGVIEGRFIEEDGLIFEAALTTAE